MADLNWTPVLGELYGTLDGDWLQQLKTAQEAGDVDLAGVSVDALVKHAQEGNDPLLIDALEKLSNEELTDADMLGRVMAQVEQNALEADSSEKTAGAYGRSQSERLARFLRD